LSKYGERNRELVPNFLDLGAMATDTRAVQTLRELAQGLNPITDALNDSMTLSGSEAYQRGRGGTSKIRRRGLEMRGRQRSELPPKVRSGSMTA